MGKCRDNEENDCDEKNCIEDAAPPQKSNSKSINDNKNPNGSLLKIQTRDGWVFRWTTPQKPLVRSVIPGPFLRPKLVHARPYVVTSNCKDCTEKSVPVERKLRNGIPDPWIEYLVWKENSSPKDVRCSWDYIWLTDYIWKSRGLAMVQGIPDPWRVGLDCPCLDFIEEKPKKPKPTKAKDSRSSVKRDLRAKANAAAEEKLKREKREDERNAYERVKDKMTELEDELRLRDAGLALLRDDKAAAAAAASKSKPARKSKDAVVEKIIDKPLVKKVPKEKVVLRCDKAAYASKPKVAKKCNDKVDKPQVKKITPKFVPFSPPKYVPKSIPCNPPKSVPKSSPCSPRKCVPKFVPCSPPKCVPKSCSTKRVSFDGVKDRMKKCNEDIMKIRKDTKLAQQKIQTLKKKKKKDDDYAPCPGKCGRVMRNEKLLRSIKLNEDTESVESVKEFLKEINHRIAITKNVLNSPDMKITENKKSTKRERGAGDNPCEVIDLQQPSLFSRRRCDNSEIQIDATEIPDHVDCEVRCYRQTPRRNRAKRESELLIVEAFSEQD